MTDCGGEVAVQVGEAHAQSHGGGSRRCRCLLARCCNLPHWRPCSRLHPRALLRPGASEGQSVSASLTLHPAVTTQKYGAHICPGEDGSLAAHTTLAKAGADASEDSATHPATACPNPCRLYLLSFSASTPRMAQRTCWALLTSPSSSHHVARPSQRQTSGRPAPAGTLRSLASTLLILRWLNVLAFLHRRLNWPPRVTAAAVSFAGAPPRKDLVSLT